MKINQDSINDFLSNYAGERILFKPLVFFELLEKEEELKEKKERRYLCENLNDRSFYGTLSEKITDGLMIKKGMLVEDVTSYSADSNSLDAFLATESEIGNDSAENIYLNCVLSDSGIFVPEGIVFEKNKVEFYKKNYSAIVTDKVIMTKI